MHGCQCELMARVRIAGERAQNSVDSHLHSARFKAADGA